MSLSFQQESPYLHCELQDTLHASQVQSQQLKEITQKMEEYTRISKQLAACGSDISEMLYRSIPPTGDSATSSIKHLSSILSEVSTSTDILSETLQLSFVRPMELFLNSKELTEIELLYDQYHHQRSLQENLLRCYLSSDFIKPAHSGGVREDKRDAASSIEKKALYVVENHKKLVTCRFDLIARSSACMDRRILEVTEGCTLAAMGLINFASTLSTSISSSSSASLNKISLGLYGMKKGYMDMQVSQGRQRRDLEAVLEAMIERVLYQLPPETSSTFWSGSHAGVGTAVGSSLYLDYDDHILLSDSTSIKPPTSTSSRVAAAAASSSYSVVPKRSVFSFSKPTPASKQPATTGGIGGTSGGGTTSSDPFTLRSAEVRLKVLELPPEINSLYSPLSQYTFFSQRVRKQGYIFYIKNKLLPDKKHNFGAQWRRDWAVLDDTKLYLVREGFDMELLVNLEVCSVRDQSDVFSYCLEIANANRSSLTLLCEGETEYKEWKRCLRAAIEDRLGASLPMRLSTSFGRLNESTYDVSHLLSLSPLCADCKQGYTDTPHSWVSLNNGTKVCIECSGVHRGLGSHISKVRSLTLDELAFEEYEYLGCMLQEDVNQRVWEGREHISEGDIAADHDKAKGEEFSACTDREEYVRRKYVSKAFMARKHEAQIYSGTTSDAESTNVSDLTDASHFDGPTDQEMMAFIADNDVINAMLCLHRGACSTASSRTDALTLACEKNAVACVVMLVLNSDGIDVDVAAVLRSAKGNEGIERYIRDKWG